MGSPFVSYLGKTAVRGEGKIPHSSGLHRTLDVRGGGRGVERVPQGRFERFVGAGRSSGWRASMASSSARARGSPGTRLWGGGTGSWRCICSQRAGSRAGNGRLPVAASYRVAPSA